MNTKATGMLQRRFMIPPFSVLDTKLGYWQDRRREWLSLGIQSEVGRGENLLKMSKQVRQGYDKEKIKRAMGFYKPGAGGTVIPRYANTFNTQKVTGGWTGTSIFDPVLCEIVYKWFLPPNGKVLDPFAGGSVRGIVATTLGFGYTGIDLRQEQVDSNNQQAKTLGLSPQWITGDSTNVCKLIPKDKFDLVFSCPPYYDLETYSDMPQDLSNAQSYEGFLDMYSDIIRESLKKLNDNSFAVFVVANIRNQANGFYRDLVGDTVRIFENHGAHFYNDIILVNSLGSLPLRVTNQFSKYRKVGKTHQNVLVFFKGDDDDVITERFGIINAPRGSSSLEDGLDDEEEEKSYGGVQEDGSYEGSDKEDEIDDGLEQDDVIDW